MTLSIAYRYLGVVPYRTALRLQETLVEHRLQARRENAQHTHWEQDVVLLLQHPPTYTTGTRRFALRTTLPADADATAERARLATLGAEYVETRRGGQITFHGPGQLVGYPLLDLRAHQLGVRDYVCRLERTIINACAHYQLSANTTDDTGVWIGDKKIAALGIQVRRYLTSHGFALNCNTDLSWFSHIIPCGLRNKGVTSITQALAEQQVNAPAVHVTDALPTVVDAMGQTFGCRMVPLEQACPALATSMDALLQEARIDARIHSDN
ncbi:hypothetical protein THASP1DRAFT_32167 [Thamnocephalis sphaerospora]|uniref:lipoyl(octanoyl) transferase n=1 Tax=Thamnocephalis sphaerospora TaxID=78915 RepID=A0A4P9XJS5_9FUNG|nr:hypothetical protein THASP1DRAFT_32167 [Thamnocephalis sphaerospora]|eukprot:RKP06005.1 hypothetical protein THASP1DRAFT_32167 [Thamnocephalis sphaerospora]